MDIEKLLNGIDLFLASDGCGLDPKTLQPVEGMYEDIEGEIVARFEDGENCPIQIRRYRNGDYVNHYFHDKDLKTGSRAGNFTSLAAALNALHSHRPMAKELSMNPQTENLDTAAIFKLDDVMATLWNQVKKLDLKIEKDSENTKFVKQCEVLKKKINALQAKREKLIG